MQFTKGSVRLNMTSVTSYGVAFKSIINAFVQVIPGLSIKSVTTDTDNTYNATLSYRGLDIRCRNSGENVYYTFGNAPEGTTHDAVHPGLLANIYYLYSESGAFCVKVLYPQHPDASGISCIPVTVILSNGTQKELLFARYGVTRIGAPTFYSDAILISSRLAYDPDSGDYYSYTLNSPSYQEEGQIGNTSVLPRTLACDYGEVVNYEVNGGKFYTIYPGCSSSLVDNNYGLLPVLVGSVRYICVGNDVWIEA